MEHYAFYGEHTGVRTARKHVGWYLAGMPGWAQRRADFNALEQPRAQLAALDAFLSEPPSRLDNPEPGSAAVPAEATLEMA